MQNDFADPAGSLYVRGGEAIVEVVNAELDAAAAAGSVTVCTQDWHPESTPHFAKDGGIWPVHCVAETWGARLHPGLRVPPGTATVRKGVRGEDGYSGFSVRDPTTGVSAATGLDAALRARGIQSVVVVGLATDYCVKETALDAARHGYATSVLADAVRAVDLQEGDGVRSLAELRAAGVTVP
jgi:nicotinamidase/pyrazinamidase